MRALRWAKNNGYGIACGVAILCLIAGAAIFQDAMNDRYIEHMMSEVRHG